MFIGDLWNLHDGNYRSLPAAWQHSVTGMIFQGDRRKDALEAALLADSYIELPPREKNVNAFHVYNALRSNRGEATKAVEQCVEELIRIGRCERSPS